MANRDKRPVDELSIEELERILAIKKREARQVQMERARKLGRAVDPVPPASVVIDEGEQTSSEIVPQTVSAPTAQPRPRAVQSANAGGSVPAEVPRFEDGDEAIIRFEEAPAKPREVYEVTAEPRSARARRKVMDRLLLLVEVAAVIGVVVIVVNLFGAIQMLERETAEAQAAADEQRRTNQPTLAPTPTLRLENFVLPGGHTVQDGLPVFNYAEVPSHLQPLVESQWIQPVISRPQPSSETALSLIIPDLNINQSIVQGVDWEALRLGIGQLVNGADPGDDYGNVVFAAHNDIYGQIFRYLDQLEVGDQFQVQTATNVYTYTVTETRIVAPNDVSVLEERGGATATLISCYPYQVNTQRIIVFADRV